MGNSQSKIKVLDIPSKVLQQNLIAQPAKYVPPFRKFSSQYHKKSSGPQHQFIMRVKAPEDDLTLSITQLKFNDIQQAYEQKTKNFEILSIIFDEYYTNRFTYIVKDLELTKTILIRDFEGFESHAFENIACEVFITEQISKIASKNLLKLNQSYLIQNEQIKFENSKTQVFQFEGVAASLSQVIKYRRQNSWEWSQIQFNQLVFDLVSGLAALHEVGICHNDIRPDNVFYCSQKKSYLIGQFCYSTKNATKGNLRNRANQNYASPEANSCEQYDFKKADVFGLGITLLCALFLCDPLDIQQASKHRSRFTGLAGFKAVEDMLKNVEQRRTISVILASLKNPNFQSKLMQDMIESLRYKTKPRNKNQRIFKQASSEFFKRLGLWEDWRVEVDQILQSNHNLSNYQNAELYQELALIHYCQDDLDQSTMNAKRSAKAFRQMGEEALRQKDFNLSLKYFKQALECSRFYLNSCDMDLAKSLICLSKVHAQKRQQQFSSTLLRQATELIIKQSSKESIIYCEMKIKEAELAKKFFRYEKALEELDEVLKIAKKMQPINNKLSKLCQAKILTLTAESLILLNRHRNFEQKRSITTEKAEQYLNMSRNIYESLQQIDCHLELAQNTEILGQLYVEKQNYTNAKLSFEKSLEMRKQYQESRGYQPFILEHATTLLNLGKCERLMNSQKDTQIYKKALQHLEKALETFKNVYGSDHNYHSAVALKEMGSLYQQMGQVNQSKECFRCSKQILEDLYGQKSPYEQIGDPQIMMRN